MSTDSMKGVLASGRRAAPPVFADRTEDLTQDPAIVTHISEDVGLEDADLSQSLRSDTALLIVTKTMFDGMPAFELYFHHNGGLRSATRSHELARQRPNPNCSLAVLTSQDIETPQLGYWRKTYGKVRNWWTELGLHSFSAWVGDLVAAGDDPKLIVWDETDYEIPWELFYRDPRVQRQVGPMGWLGELIRVIRWTSPWHCAVPDRRCDGELVVAERVEAEQPTADPFAEYPVIRRLDGLREMVIELGRDDLGTFGLVIAHVHGKFSQQAGDFTLDGVPLNELDEYPMDALARSGALVLLNACASGRASVDPANRLAVPRSFVEVFLRSGAGGVIATAADIDLNQRHDFAVRLVAGARSEDINVAEMLRGQRAESAKKASEIRRLRDEADIERGKPPAKRTLSDDDLTRMDEQIDAVYKRFFASFAYLYFGHPDTVLRVRAAGEP